MDALALILGLLLSSLPLLVGGHLWRRFAQSRTLAVRPGLFVVGAGALAGLVHYRLVSLLLGMTGLSLEVGSTAATKALLAMLFFAAPLGQALKLLAIWPLYRRRIIDGRGTGLLYATLAAAGFAAVDTFNRVVLGPLDGVLAVRVLLGALGHLFFAGMWGYALGAKRTHRRSWFLPVWLLATAMHGLFEHIAFGRGPASLVALLPLGLSMAVTTSIIIRELTPARALTGPRDKSLHSSGNSERSSLTPPSPSLDAVVGALGRRRPVMLRWVVVGALVNFGLMISLLVLAVLMGRAMGVDFATADEGDWRSAGPFLLLGAAIVAAFPCAGYLIAKASAAGGVFESALGAAVALACLVTLLGTMIPTTVLFALVIAPVAFALACGGAWFGSGP